MANVDTVLRYPVNPFRPLIRYKNELRNHIQLVVPSLQNVIRKQELNKMLSILNRSHKLSINRDISIPYIRKTTKSIFLPKRTDISHLWKASQEQETGTIRKPQQQQQ